MLEGNGRNSDHARMTTIRGKCLGIDITINPDRKVVQCDSLEFPCGWKEGDGYFLVKIEDGNICVGWVDGGRHELNIEFRGSDPDKLIREVTRQDFVDKPHAAYIAARDHPRPSKPHRRQRIRPALNPGAFKNLQRAGGGAQWAVRNRRGICSGADFQ